jgi:SAM-dependent methyltransferase
VAIENAINSVSKEKLKPAFIVGDVTNLDKLNRKFDLSYDVGCFHCLNEEAQLKYVSEVYRLLKPGGVHLIWALDHSPCDLELSPDYMAKIFGNKFKLEKSRFSRRRLIASHWYWLVREI